MHLVQKSHLKIEIEQPLAEFWKSHLSTESGWLNLTFKIPLEGRWKSHTSLKGWTDVEEPQPTPTKGGSHLTKLVLIQKST